MALAKHGAKVGLLDADITGPNLPTMMGFEPGYQANEGGGTWSKSMTHTQERDGTVSSRTKSMAHEPGGAPAKSTVGSSATAPQ